MKKVNKLFLISSALLLVSGAAPTAIKPLFAADDPMHDLDVDRNAYVVKDIFDEEFASGITETWNSGKGAIVSGGFHSDKAWKQNLNGDDNSEIYWEFGEILNLKDKTNQFDQEGCIEFYVKTNSNNTWFKLYALERRSNPEGPAVNQQYNRSEIDLTMYIDRSRTDEWQFVQVPMRNFSTRGAYVDKDGTRQSGMVDITNICGIGFAQLSSVKGEHTYYDKIRITNFNLPDKYMGCKMKQASEMDEIVKSMDITKVDLAPYATTGFVTVDGKPGWSGQGVDNELTGFNLYGNQVLGHIPYYIVNPATNNNKSVIGLRNDGSGKSIYTDKVSIPVNKKLDGFYIIHNVSWSLDSSHPADYIFEYDDGTEYKVELQTGRDILDWWGTGESDVCPIYWTGENVEAMQGYNKPIKVNGYGCVNKYPDKQVKNLRFEVYSGNTSAEDLIVALTLAYNNGNGLPMPYLDNPYNPDTSTWYEYEMPNLAKIVGSPLDVSYLMDPNSAEGIDEKGRIVVKNGAYVYEKTDKKVLFNGTNVSGELIYQNISLNDGNVKNHAQIDLLVDLLAAYGFNLVRLMDWDATFYHPNFFENPNTNKLSSHYGINENALDAMMYFIAKCKSKGIYIQFCCLGGRTGGTLPDFAKERQEDLGGGMKFEIFIDKDISDEVVRVIKTILCETNPYTGTKLAEDNQLALMEMANESNFSNMYGLYKTSMSYEFVSDYYKDLAAHSFTDFLLKKYGTFAELRSAWTDPDGIKIGVTKQERDSSLISLDQYWMADKYTDARHQDTFNYLYDCEMSFYKGFYDRLVGSEFNIVCPITATTNLPSESMQDLYINAQFDYIARHSYASHPTTGTEYQVGTATGSVYSQAAKISNLYSTISGQVIYNEAYIVNETNIAEPSRYTSEFSVMNSAIYLYQGWSVCTFTFSATVFDAAVNQITDSFSILNMPTRMGTLTSGAILFYSQEIAEASTGYYESLSAKQAEEDYASQTWSIVSGLYLVGKTGVYFADEEGNNINQENGNPANNDALLERINHQFITSDNGDMIFAKDGSFFAVNTESTQSVIGQYGDKSITLNDVSVRTDNRYSTVTLSALKKQTDGTIDLSKDIKTSDHLLLNASATMRNAGSEYSTDGLEITGIGDSPILVEPVTGEVTLRSFDTFEVYALNTSGQRTNRVVQTSKDSHGYTVIHLSSEDKTMNYEIVRIAKGSGEHLSNYADVENEDNELVISYGQYLQTITDELYMLNADVSRGDFLVSLVRAFDLKKRGSVHQYADVDLAYYGYNELEIAHSHYLYEANYVNPYDSLKKTDAYQMIYNYLIEVEEKDLASGDAFVNNRSLEELLSESVVNAINALYGSGYITLDDINTLTKDEKFTRKEALEAIKMLKEGQPEPHVHTFAEEWSSNDTQHWHAATCGHDVKDGLADHVDANGDKKCDVCGKELPNIGPQPIEPEKKEKGCGGSIIASSIIVASVSLIGASLLISKKRKGNIE